MQEVRGQISRILPLLVGNRFQVLFHSPHRGAFHLSLTVLVHYRSYTSIWAWRVLPPCSDRITRVPPYSSPDVLFSHTGLSPARAHLSKCFGSLNTRHWPGPLSLA